MRRISEHPLRALKKSAFVHVPIATLAGGEVQFHATLDAETEWQARKALLRSAVAPASYQDRRAAGDGAHARRSMDPGR